MAVKILIKRTFKENKLREATKLLIEARFNAMAQEGYISSENMVDMSNPNKVVVASMLQKIENWENWKNSKLRETNEVKLEKLLKALVEYEPYVLGPTINNNKRDAQKFNASPLFSKMSC